MVTKERGWTLGVCVTIQSLYREKRVAWLWACHDTTDCIVTREKKVWLLAVSRYSTTRAAIRPQQRPQYNRAAARPDAAQL